jgi:tRNA (guanosine-2'-O-)-methyltransferase
MLKEKYEKILTTYLSTDSIPLYKVDFTRSIALVFGNEHEGVSEEIRKMADGNFIISQVGMIRSLNIQWLARLDLYEAFDQPSRVLCSAPIARG